MKISQKLLTWYRGNRRDLPWRKTRDPYRIWISEVMLQQTTVAVVTPYYERFIHAFPTVATLAQAPEEQVLSLWSGLGYYSRARNLHKAAKEIVRQGSFPKTYDELRELPGIGPYTAAAVASIAFDQEVAAIDGNVVRVITRLYDIAAECTSKNALQEIQNKAQALIQGQPPSEHNQAMMELGATICVPQNPCCLMCPLMAFCQARVKGTTEQRPVKNKKKKPEPWLWEMYVVRHKGRIAMVKENNGTPWLKNTWVLPGRASPWMKKNPPESDLRHSITHHKIFVKLKAGKPSLVKDQQIKWVTETELEKIGTSSIVQKALKSISKDLFLFLGFLVVTGALPQLGQAGNISVVPPKEQVLSSTPEPLTHIGDNQQGQFSRDGSLIIFQSANRPEQKNGQIYVLHLDTKKEKRITYNDGEDAWPDFSPDGKTMIYASTTDELKEHPAPSPAPAAFSGKEIYESDVDGSHISRLTQSVGFDGEPSYLPDGHHILFTSNREGTSKLFIMNSNGSSQKPFLESKSSESQGIFSHDGKWVAWVGTEDGGKGKQIYISDKYGRHPRPITRDQGIHETPSWSLDDKKILFSDDGGENHRFKIYITDATDGNCLNAVTTGPGNDLGPEFSPDGKRILFTSDRSGSNQLYIMDFIELSPCSSHSSI